MSKIMRHADDYPTAPLRPVSLVRRGSAVAVGTFACVVCLVVGGAAAFMVDAATAPPAPGRSANTSSDSDRVSGRAKVVRTKHAPGVTVVETAPPVTHWRSRPRRTVVRTVTRTVTQPGSTVTVSVTPAVTP